MYINCTLLLTDYLRVNVLEMYIKHKIFYFTIKNISRISTMNQTNRVILTGFSFFSLEASFEYPTDLKVGSCFNTDNVKK